MDKLECIQCHNNQLLLGPFEGFLIRTDRKYEQKGIINIERTYNVNGIISINFYVCEICLKNHLYNSGFGCLIWGIIFLAGSITLLKWYFWIENYTIGLICSIALFVLFIISITIFIKAMIDRSKNIKKKFVYDKNKMESSVYIIAALAKSIRHPDEIKKLINGEKIEKF